MSEQVIPHGVVLMVDDTPTNLNVLFDALRGSGLRLLVATDGESAIERARYARPDIILLDVMMPGLDGFETCRRLKSYDETRDIPVIFMTALTDTAEKVRGLSAGAVDYVTKPIHPEEVLARLSTHLTIARLQRTLQEKNVELEAEIAERGQLIEELNAFAHTVAHDLKGPLTPILTYATALKEGWNDLPKDERDEFLDVIARSARKIHKIIDALLLLASVRRGKVESEPLDMARIVTDLLGRIEYLIEDVQATVTMPALWPVARGYAPWVEEVWANYLSNAIKYGGEPPHIELGGELIDGMCRFWVRDNGKGLTREQRASLFTPFTRLEQGRGEGHGLGLSIVQRIVERLGGTVGIESEPGRGSVFSFTLPCATEPR